ncbi:MAG TPA: hypothetical protein VNW52_11500, partial [Burkholderiaceae bacterium]|nr:hypothetical protein [Burkholderiaceae bacterium]
DVLTLADHIDMRTPERFSLIGRTGDMVKIAGKRTSLEALNAALLAIDGIDDACFYRPQSPGGDQHDDQRLKAFVVAPQLSTQQIISKLRDLIDSAFIPRPLWKVEQLPRNGNGKIAQIELEKLAMQCAQRGGNNVSHDTGAISGIVSVDHPALNGHFPDNPIVPGMLLLSEVTELAARSHRITGIKQAKFHAPLRPDQAYTIKLDQATRGSVKFVIMHEQVMIASGLLQCEAPA